MRLKPYKDGATPLDVALHWAGWCVPVFPVNGTTKAPITPNGWKDATIERDQIEQWWRENPDAAVAISNGTGLLRVVAFDIDVSESANGVENFARFCRDRRVTVPKTIRTKSIRGGGHILFYVPEGMEAPKRSTNPPGNMAGIDLLGVGGYQIVFGERPGGRFGDFEPGFGLGECDLAPVPHQLIDAYEQVVKVARAERRDLVKRGGKYKAGERHEPLVEQIGVIVNQAVENGADESVAQDLILKAFEWSGKNCDPPHDINNPEDVKEIGSMVRDFLGRDIEEAKRAANGPDPDKKKKGPPSAGVLAQMFINATQIKLIWWRGAFYRWDVGRYVQMFGGKREVELRGLVNRWLMRHQFLSGLAGGSKVNAILDCLQTIVAIPATTEPGTNMDTGEVAPIIVFRNGTCLRDEFFQGDIRTEEDLDPPTPAVLNFSHLPYDFVDLEAECPRWQKFLDEMVPDRAEQARLQQAFGLTMYGRSNQEALYVLTGDGANGKSVILTVLRQLVGPEACSSVPLEAFRPDRTFLIASLLGKRANIVDEIGDIDKVGEGLLKSVVTGSPITVERKNEHPFVMTPEVALWFSTNTLPRVTDRTEGLWRRLVLFQLRERVPVEDRDTRLIDPRFWVESGELPAILQWAVDGWNDLQERGWFRDSEVSLGAAEEYRRNTQSELYFLRESVVEAKGKLQDKVTLYQTYRRHCRDEFGGQPVGRPTFDKTVRRLFPEVREVRPRIEVMPGEWERRRCWDGLVYDPEATPDDESVHGPRNSEDQSNNSQKDGPG